MDHMTSKSNFGIYEPSATGASKTEVAGNVQQQILDALTILTTPQMVVDDPKKLRDQFAMAALARTSFTCIASGSDYHINQKDDIVKLVWEVADAMMKAREAK